MRELRTSIRWSVAALGFLVCWALAQPREWQDDFVTVTTYDSMSLYAACYGGPPTKYTLFDAIGGLVSTNRGLSGSGMLLLTGKARDVLYGAPRLDFAIIGWLGFGFHLFEWCPISNKPPFLQTSEAFTSSEVCIYGGMQFNP